MAKPARLLRPEELGVGDHLMMIRRHGGTGGRPPREDELVDPNRDELASAGWTKPAPERPTPAPSTTVEAQLEAINPHDLARKRRDLGNARKDLANVFQGGVVPGEVRGRSMQRLPSLIANLETEIAAGEAAVEEAAVAKRAAAATPDPSARFAQSRKPYRA
jgi:hypothetical protein